jgi:RNA polymerase sigma factor (sigma-70 family)
MAGKQLSFPLLGGRNMEDKFRLGIKHQIFNNEVRKRRIEMGYTQQDLAKVCGIGKQTIGHIETFRQYPDIKKAKRIAEVLQSDIKTLFPQWLEVLKGRKTTIITEHLVTERLIEHPELNLIPSEVGSTEELENNTDLSLLKDNIQMVIKSLSEREQKVLKMRFGLDGNKEMTYDELGREFGVTRERIRQVECKALRKLKHPSRKCHLESFL